jgi:NADPH:quinone reductase-like Zn-dependent oxidoreductase
LNRRPLGYEYKAAMTGNPLIWRKQRLATPPACRGFFLNHPDVELKIPGALRETAPLVASGVIRIPISGTYPLTAFREAVAHVQRGGKVVFDIGE